MVELELKPKKYLTQVHYLFDLTDSQWDIFRTQNPEIIP